MPNATQLPLDAQLRIDSVCDAFEHSWRSGVRPALDDFLAQSTDGDREHLVGQLVRLDVAYRRRAGEQPRLRDYGSSLPGLEPLLDALSIADVSGRAARFRVQRPHARGGLGQVSVALDTELNREVAYKELRPDRADSPAIAARFIREAELTGGLEHPGIVPVYSLGRDAEGRPFYAMRFIRGEGLDNAIRKLHGRWEAGDRRPEDARSTAAHGPSPTQTQSAAAENRPEAEGRRPEDTSSADAAAISLPPASGLQPPALRSLPPPASLDFGSSAFRQLLNRYIAVCQAMEYAHSKDVIHRDLKPSNIMIGEYGETLVVDWGLAKTDRRAGGVSPLFLEPLPSDEFVKQGANAPRSPAHDDSETLIGMIAGTPAYMSPEQATGNLATLTSASDVYSLGATLYELLTGRAPARGASTKEILESVGRGDFARPRDVDRRVPRGLEAICLKAMAPRPDDRYGSASNLAEDLEHWLADERVSALRESPADRLARWGRKHRTWVTAGAAALALIAAISIAAALVVNRQRQIAASLAVANGRLATSEQAARKDAETKRNEAVHQRDQNELVLKRLVDVFRSPDPKRDGYQVMVVEVFARAIESIRADQGLDPLTRAKLLGSIGEACMGLKLNVESIQAWDEVLKLQTTALGERHEDSLVSANNLGLAHLNAGEPNRAATLFERTLAGWSGPGRDPDDPERLAVMNNLGLALRDSGRLEEAVKTFDESLKLHRERLGPEHSSTIAALGNFAMILQRTGEYERALPLYKETLAACEKAFGLNDARTMNTVNELATTHQAMGKNDLAIPLYKTNLNRRRANLGPEHTDTLSSLNNLATAYGDDGQVGRSLALFEEALDLQRRVLSADHPDLLTTMNNIAMAHLRLGAPDKAVPLLKVTLELTRAKLGDDHPDTLRAINNLAGALQESKQVEASIPLFEQALELRKKHLGEDHPDTLLTAMNLATAYRDDGDEEKALALFDENLRREQAKLGDGHPLTLHTLFLLAELRLKRGEVETGADLARTLVRRWDDRDKEIWGAHRARSLLGAALSAQQKYPEAEEVLLAAHAGLTRTQESIPPLYRHAILRDAVERLVKLYEAWGKPEQADEWRSKLEDPKPPDTCDRNNENENA